MIYVKPYSNVKHPQTGAVVLIANTIYAVGEFEVICEDAGIDNVECQLLMADSHVHARGIAIHNVNHYFATSLKG